jgi:hypothetical protein
MASARLSRPLVSLIFLSAHAFADWADNESGERCIGRGFDVDDLRIEGYDIPCDRGRISYGFEGEMVG